MPARTSPSEPALAPISGPEIKLVVYAGCCHLGWSYRHLLLSSQMTTKV